MNNVHAKLVFAGLAALAAGFLLHLTARPGGAQSNEAALVAKAKQIHDRVIKLDTHNDIDPSDFTPECNYTMHLTTQVNLPKMIDGDMDVSFMIAYVGQGALTPQGYENAYRTAVAKFDAVHRLTEQIAPDQIGLALTPADVVKLHSQGKRIAVIGVENGYPIGTDVKRVKEFFNRGGRYMSLAHNGNSQLADSNTGEAQGYLYNNGLSPLGREVIAEMNRLGMMVDLSHPSKGANMEAIKLSKAPVIGSHSAVRALANVSRNMDDELLLALKANGGVIQVVGFASYLKIDPPERTEALAQLREEFGVAQGGRGGGGNGGGAAKGAAAKGSAAKGGAAKGGAAKSGASKSSTAKSGNAPPAPACAMESASLPVQQASGGRGQAQANAAPAALSPERRAAYEKKLAEIDVKWPAAGRANVKDLVNHIDYAANLIGINHVGISSDFDGGGGIDGWNSAADAFNVTLELVRRGYTEEQIGKLWSGNLLRVWAEVEKVAQELQ